MYQEETVTWKAPNETQGHPDYQRNLQTAQNLLKAVDGKLPNGMRVKIADSEHIQKALVIISWKPGFTEPLGNYATPVNMNQPKEQFNTELKSVVDVYYKSTKDYNNRSPQPDWFNAKNVHHSAFSLGGAVKV